MPSAEEKIQATKPSLFFGQLLLITWIALGTAGFWLINPLYGWLYLAFSAFSIYIIIRRLMCNSCYYCKSCTKGLAKLSIMSLGANRIPGLGQGTILGSMAYIFVILTVIPALLLTNVFLAAGLLAVSALSVVLRIIKGNKVITQ